MRVLLTGARAPATLELARLCARSWHAVHVADTMTWHICRGSRLIAGAHRLPAPRTGHGACAAAVNDLITRQRIDLVVPTCEEVFHLAAIRERLQAPVLCEPRARLAALHDKARFIAESERAGLPVPCTHALLHGATELPALPTARYILKPRFSRFATRVLARWTGQPLPTLDPHHGGWIAQEQLDGRARCTWSVAHRGVLVAHATYAVDQTAGPRGAAISFHSLRDAAALSWVRQFVACHGLSGQFAFDFIDTGSGLRAIECNPRLTSGVHCFRGQPVVAAAAAARVVPAPQPAHDARGQGTWVSDSRIERCTGLQGITRRGGHDGVSGGGPPLGAGRAACGMARDAANRVGTWATTVAECIVNAMAWYRSARYLAAMRLIPALVSLVLLPATVFAQSAAGPDSLRTTGGLSLGLSGWKSSDGSTVVADVMWVGDDINDGPGFRFMRQALAPRTHGYVGMLFIGGPPRDSINWMRLDFGFGYVGQQSDRDLKFYQRHGIGVQFGATLAPFKLGIVRPELNGWGVLGTSARFLGVSIGARILDPRQLR